MGQPDIQQTFNAVSVEGFDQIYQPEPSQAQSGPDVARVDPTPEAQTGPALEVQPDPAEGVSLEDAAKLLGLHMDTVRKRLQKGKIKGFKVADKFGEKWLVHRDELPKAQTLQPDPILQAQAAPDLIEVVAVAESVTVHRDPMEAQGNPVIEIEAGPEQVQSDPIPSKVDDVEYQRLMQIIESQAHQLKAAGDVIMYLRGEVDEAKTQVKLLTDSQHQNDWWARFRRWLTGSQAVK